MSLGVPRFLDEGQNRLHPTESRIRTLLKEHSWELRGRNALPPLTDRERAMTRLPMTSCFIDDGADFQATKFCTERVETNKKACDSIVITLVQDPSRPIVTPHIGRVQAFISHVPPWASHLPYPVQQKQAIQIANVDWYKSLGPNHQLYNCPAVNRVMKRHPDGSFVICNQIHPVPIGLVPYLGDEYVQNSWQVVTRDVAVFKPAIDRRLPAA